MRKPELMLLVFFAIVNLSALAQNQNSKFKLLGEDKRILEIEQKFKDSKEITPFEDRINKIYGLAVDAEIEFTSDKSQVRFVLIDENFDEHLIFEAYPLLSGSNKMYVEESCEETALLDGVKPYALQIEVIDANVNLHKLTYANRSEIANIRKVQKENRQEQNLDKIIRLNQHLKAKGQNWVAGQTTVSEMSFAERKKLYGQSTFPAGFEFYAGGVISSGESNTTSTALKSATTSSPYVEDWDWRDRHGKNWITPIANQEFCGSCWAFSTAGATEAMTNLYFNQQINLDLSEQDLISCGNAGDCNGGYPFDALDYITNTGIIDEVSFPYRASAVPCSEKTNSPNEHIQISGKVQFGRNEYLTKSEDNLKDMIINLGPLSGALSDWSHAMVLVGYKVVHEGDVFFYRDLNLDRYWKTIDAGDLLIGKTVWIFKNSWGDYFGDQGYVYVETPMDNIVATFGLKTPVISKVNNYEVVCTDADGDGYYWWGLGPKPANCPPSPDLADGDDSDPTKGPLDQYGYCIPLGPVASPVADFTADAIKITEGDKVNFSDASTNGPSSWSWTFTGGNPATSTAQNPTVTYDTPGNYEVSLTVANSGGSDTKTISGYITVNRILTPPVADFVADITTLKEGGTVTFTDLSTNTPNSWSWSFNGGTPDLSTEKNPSITYNTPGSFTVSLTATNADGSSTKTATQYINVTAKTPPLANFTATTTSVEEGSSVQFTDLSDNNPYEWQWNFPGGTANSTTIKNPSVTYSTAGTYDVSLTVTNDDGSDNITMTGFVTVTEKQKVVLNPPVANFTKSAATVETGKSVTFTDQSSNTPTSWAWTFTGNDIYTSTVQNPVVTFNTAGIYDVSLIASNADGSDTILVTSCITVSNPPAPIADFSADNTQVVEGGQIGFTDKSSNAPETWYWVFEGGEPATSTERNPKVTYKNPNSYKVSLTVTNKGGNNTKTVENYIQVEKAQPEYCVPSPLATNEWISQVQIGSVTYSSTPNGYTDNTGNVFELEGGLSHTINLVPDFNPRSKFEYWAVWIDYNSDFSFTDDEKVFSSSKSKSAVSGTITLPAVTSTVTTRIRIAMGSVDPTACDFSVAGDVEDYTIQILPEQAKAPVADFAANLYTIYVGESIQFSDLSANNPETYEWSFPGADTETSIDQNPTITYSTAGVYDVSLTVSKTGFDPSTKNQSQIITVKEVGDVTYCFPSNLNSTVNFISKVDIGSFSRTSAGEDYTNYTAETINLVPGAAYNVGLVPSNSSARNFWRIWIDFNNDGDFDDADETLLTANNSKGSVNSAISIPAYATGDVRMRITMKTGKSPGSCDDGFEGEVEDYTVSLGGASASYGDKMAASASPFEELDETFLKVYPNPTEQNVHIKLSMLGSDDSYAVYNASGSKILESAITDLLSTIDLSMHPSGLYIVVINSQSNNYTEKIIKK
ncbi:PKD domain-containing protein [Maribellus sediminis]|uniref:PKD domain-containing protein n=1 Tax=Maribellus sediminis TaxID=2696285 RepID=UPI0014310A7F|nr:PKD domain-containing protein [Maribellus sediminis]